MIERERLKKKEKKKKKKRKGILYSQVGEVGACTKHELQRADCNASVRGRTCSPLCAHPDNLSKLYSSGFGFSLRDRILSTRIRTVNV